MFTEDGMRICKAKSTLKKSLLVEVSRRNAESDVYLIFDRYYDYSIKSVTRNVRETVLRKLCEHFEPLLTSNGCNVAEVEREWLKAKYDIVRHHKREAFLVLWQRMLIEKERKYPNLLHVVRIVLVFPVSRSQVEHQFSTMKRMQGDWRLRLNTSTIEGLLLIKSEGCDPVAFESEEAVARWWAAGLLRKRPNIQPYGPRLNFNPDPQAASPTPPTSLCPSSSDDESD
ncbi:hypothetical protein JOQ06_023453 [Pogonophryne albipinna]|uniref:HAT C-terminal dimerisation domain-containing protein n=1 Tax=Pogonophryne albipinna TaxID=1090488 RepID=A0AAD6BJ65_9TELE|nr:hypothetical protein JOQ06_023453 [Pogonophryne albipinna]